MQGGLSLVGGGADHSASSPVISMGLRKSGQGPGELRSRLRLKDGTEVPVSFERACRCNFSDLPAQIWIPGCLSLAWLTSRLIPSG